MSTDSGLEPEVFLSYKGNLDSVDLVSLHPIAVDLLRRGRGPLAVTHVLNVLLRAKDRDATITGIGVMHPRREQPEPLIPVVMSRTDPSATAGFPRIWELFPVLLPRSLREQIYEPAHEDLKSEYLETRRWSTPWAKRWITFCFTIKTAGLVAQSLWACLGGTTRKAIIGLVALLFGERVVSVVREKLAEWLGRLP